jgi:hypothetical protein
MDTEDDCYYFGEYTARAGYAFSTTNDLIQNLKSQWTGRVGPSGNGRRG